MTTGYPSREAMASASSTVWAISLRGISMPRRVIVSLKALRSSPRLMASTATPITLTPYLSRMPFSANSLLRFRPDWPPRLGRRASGFSTSMISVILSTFRGSM